MSKMVRVSTGPGGILPHYMASTLSYSSEVAIMENEGIDTAD